MVHTILVGMKITEILERILNNSWKECLGAKMDPENRKNRKVDLEVPLEPSKWTLPQTVRSRKQNLKESALYNFGQLHKYWFLFPKSYVYYAIQKYATLLVQK